MKFKKKTIKQIIDNDALRTMFMVLTS